MSCSKDLDLPCNYCLCGPVNGRTDSDDLRESHHLSLHRKAVLQKVLQNQSVPHHSPCKLILSTNPNEREYVQVVLSSILLLRTCVKA